MFEPNNNMTVWPLTRNHVPGIAEVTTQIEVFWDRVSLIQRFDRLNADNIKSTYFPMHRRPTKNVPAMPREQQPIRSQRCFDGFPFGKTAVGDPYSAPLGYRGDQLTIG